LYYAFGKIIYKTRQKSKGKREKKNSEFRIYKSTVQVFDKITG